RGRRGRRSTPRDARSEAPATPLQGRWRSPPRGPSSSAQVRAALCTLAHGGNRGLRWFFVPKQQLVRAAVGIAVVAALVGLGLALLEPTPSRTAERAAAKPVRSHVPRAPVRPPTIVM